MGMPSKLNYEEWRDWVSDNLDNPGDPYGLANKEEYLLKYIAPMACGELERAELCRRFRTRHKTGCVSQKPVNDTPPPHMSIKENIHANPTE
jgi:hypothetical protein